MDYDIFFSAAFDPKPFIRTFDTAVDTLIKIRKDVQKETTQQEQSSKVAEKEYSRKLADLNRGFEVRDRCCSFHCLDPG